MHTIKIDFFEKHLIFPKSDYNIKVLSYSTFVKCRKKVFLKRLEKRHWLIVRYLTDIWKFVRLDGLRLGILFNENDLTNCLIISKMLLNLYFCIRYKAVLWQIGNW